MLKAYRYRIYPDKAQEEFFEKTFGCCRFVWNKMLEEKLEALRQGRKVPRITPARYKKEYPFVREVDSLALANVQLEQEKAFRDHFKNPKHFRMPKFKKKKYKQSYTTNNQQPLHKLSKAIIDENQVVVVESLNVKGLSRTRLSKHILDSSWSKFLRYLKYKADWYGRKVIEADRSFPSSKMCSRCGYINKELKLKDRVWKCPKCKAVHDRDENAAKNLKNYGIAYIRNQ